MPNQLRIMRCHECKKCNSQLIGCLTIRDSDFFCTSIVEFLAEDNGNEDGELDELSPSGPWRHIDELSYR